MSTASVPDRSDDQPVTVQESDRLLPLLIAEHLRQVILEVKPDLLQGIESTPLDAVVERRVATKWEWLDEVTRSGLSPRARLALHTLATKMNANGSGPRGWSCWPSLKKVGRWMGQSEDTAKGGLSEARKRGYTDTLGIG